MYPYSGSNIIQTLYNRGTWSNALYIYASFGTASLLVPYRLPLLDVITVPMLLVRLGG